ncbi:MAG: transposase [Phycisphaerales bacterium]|nr:MAG: transposase [Phycisphaerales bacterium]
MRATRDRLPGPALALGARIDFRTECGKRIRMSDPLAYLLTWTCYGTWLHGDPRRSVDDEHNIPKTPYLAPDSIRAGRESVRLQHRPMELGVAARRIVVETIERHCRRRGWELLAVNARTNHVHAVVACPDVTPERALMQLKAWTTRRLHEGGCVPPDARVWTHHGSTRYLWNEPSVNAAIAYVLEYQGPDLH